MADETQRRVIYLEINATKAVDGSTAATRALASVEKSANSAGSAMGALEAASVAAGGAAQRTALDLANSATAATSLSSVYRTTAGGALELARATTSVTTSAQAQAAGFAKLAEQRTVQASLAQTRALMDSVARSTSNLTQMYGAATVATTTFANAQAQASGYARLAEQNAIAASAAKTRATMTAVESLTADHIKGMYYGGPSGPTSAAPGRPAVGYMGTPGQVGLNAQQKVMLGYQLQDVGVSLIGGMNPLVVAAQQGPQISMLYGGVGNMMRAIPKPALAAGGAAIGGLAIGAALKEISDVNEALEMQQRRLGALFGPGEQAAAAYREIGAMAAGTATSIAEATEAVVAFGRATRDLGGSGETAVGLATMAEKLAQLSGASKEEGGAARGALVAMFKESAVSADQLRTVLTNVPEIADKIAAGLGVSVGQLRLMTQQGDLSGRQVFGALLSQTDAVNKEFEAMPKSLGFVLKSIGIEIANMVTGLAAAVGQLTVIQSKADAIKASQAANPNRPAPATPRVIGNNGTALSLEEMVTFGEAGQYDVGNAGLLQSQILGSQRSLTAAADGAVLAASKLAAGLNPAVAEVKLLQQGVTETELALGKLQDGLTSFDASKAAQETLTLTANLQALREKADAAGSAYYQALSATQLRQQQDELGMSPGQRAYAANVANLAKPGSGVSIEDAQAVADAQQLQTLGEIVKAKQMEADASTRALEAVRKGKAATIESKVETAVLAFVWANVGKNVELTADQIKAYGDAVRTILTNEGAMGGVDASKPLLDDLAAIAAAMDAVTQGAYAMRRAEAEAKAARSDDGTGGLQLQVFDARQALTDASSLADLQRSVDLTNALAAAAGNVGEQRRIQLDHDIEIATLAAGPGARAAIETARRADEEAKLNRERKEGLATMQRDVDLAQQQLDIIRSGSPDMAAQLAMLKTRNDLLARGADVTLDENVKQIERAGQKARIDEQIGYAKEASDATKRTWMNAFDDVQSFGADTFYDIFTGVTIDGADAAKSLKNVFLRAFAEIAAAALIRPIIAPIFQAGQSLGIVPAGVGGAAWGATPTAVNSNGISIPGGFGNSFGGVGSWLNSPIANTFGRDINDEIANWATYGTPAQNSMGGLLGNMTWGQGLAGVASIGMGAYSLATSRSTAGAVGGGLGILGGGIGMAGAMGLLPMLGAAAGPIGMGLGLVGSLLPMLFGDDGGSRRTHSSTNASLRYGGGNWYTTGGAYGPGANSGQTESSLRSNTAGIDALFDLLGGVRDPSKVWGLNLNSWTAAGKNWSYTSQDTALVDPTTGNTVSWRMNEDNMMDTGSAQLVVRSILSGAVGEISQSMKIAATAMTSFAPTLKEVGENIVFVEDVYDRFGKGALTVRAQFRELEKQFGDMTETAKKLGLALEPVIAEQKKQTERLGQDYIDNLIDPVAAQLRAWQDERASILANVDYIARHTDVVVDMARINEALLRKEAALKDQLYSGAVSQLEDAIKRLGYGDLSNATTPGALAGMRGALDATVAQARANDGAAIGRLAGEITSFAEANRQAFGSSPEYEAIRRELIDLAREFQIQVSAPTQAASNGAQRAAQTANENRLLAQMANDNAELKQQVATLMATMERLLTRRS